MVASVNDRLLDWLIWNNNDAQRGKVMIKTKDKFSMSFGSELKLIYNELRTVQKGKTV